jgi:Ca2+-transporting ATPase
MNAIEALGSTTLICTDKTGTLTSGQMLLTHAVINGRDVSLQDGVRIEARAILEAARSAGATHGSADPIDIAILERAAAMGVVTSEVAARVSIPFSSTRKYSASVCDSAAAVPNATAPTALTAVTALTANVKGAPEIVLAMCALSEVDAAAIRIANVKHASGGARVIAVARGEVNSADESALTGLQFMGLLVFRDPPAAGVKEAMLELRSAGVRVVMITGDQEPTARAVAAEVGIEDIYSRVSPEHKLRIVEGFQRDGEVVAVFGDGVNDAAALRRADVGIAMGGRGTDVARQAAAIILVNDSFASIVAAVREGRVIFDNIKKFVFYLFSCNLAELIVVVAAAIAAFPMPLLPLQILWLNLVTDTFPALALAAEPGDKRVMLRSPRMPRSGLVSRAALIRIGAFAVLIASVTLAAYIWTLNTSRAEASTIAFVVLGLAQILHLGNARSHHPVLSRPSMNANRFALAAVGVSIACLAAAVYIAPLAKILGTRPLSLSELGAAVTVASVPAAIGQLVALAMERERAPDRVHA